MLDTTQVVDQITRHFGGEQLPAVFLKLSENEELLAAIWTLYEAVMSEGEIDLATKELLGLCVGVAKPNEYVIGLQQRRIRRAGIDEAAEREVISVAGFFEGFNSYAHVVNFGADLNSRQDGADRPGNGGVIWGAESSDPLVSEVFEEIREQDGDFFRS